jgi:pimeloyl-ACP methyl ester carboxylesterase
MGTITTGDGADIYFKDWGEGQPIVFSHGWPLSADDWDASMSNSFNLIGRTKIGVVWELTVAANGNGYVVTNRVVVRSTPDYVSFLDEQGIALDQAVTDGQATLEHHNNLETPLYARSIERKALAVTAAGAE